MFLNNLNIIFYNFHSISFFVYMSLLLHLCMESIFQMYYGMYRQPSMINNQSTQNVITEVTPSSDLAEINQEIDRMSVRQKIAAFENQKINQVLCNAY